MSPGSDPPTKDAFWRRFDAVETRLTAPVSERMVELLEVEPGQRVIDLATGRGEPALRIAHRVGPSGLVVCVDASGPILELARERAAREGLSNLEFHAMDATQLEGLPDRTFQSASCRWGLMYMTDPIRALRRLRQTLQSQGAFVAAFWAEPERVPYVTLPRSVLARYRKLPALDFAAPGVFRFAHVDRIQRDFSSAGFRIEHVEELDTPVFEADTAPEMLAWLRPLNPLLAELSAAAQSDFEREVLVAIERDGGKLSLGGVTRIVRATAEPDWNGAC